MTINVSNILYNINEKISGSTTDINLLFLSKSIDNLQLGKYYVVKSINNLPSASEYSNELYYVIGEDIFYVSNGTSWSEIDTTV